MANNMKNLLNDPRFIVLGDVEKMNGLDKSLVTKKILSKADKNKLDGIWGTLGWKSGADTMDLQVENSKLGNRDADKRDHITADIVNGLAQINPEIKDIATDVLERYITIDTSNASIDWKAMTHFSDFPELRLDLFVEDREGAMVYYYLQHKNNFGLLNDASVEEEFIQCQKTDDNFSTNRDRLTYYFKAIPPYDYSVNEDGCISWSDDLDETNFIVKIVTFSRNTGDPKKLLGEFFDKKLLRTITSDGFTPATYELFGKDKNKLLIYDSNVKSSSVGASDKKRYDMRGAFWKVSGEHPIDPGKKTLLLLHGTFSNTLNTFEGLVKYNNGSSELEEFLANSEYEQVIAFDHPTISADAHQNICDFKNALGLVAFAKPIGILAASRGCLVAQAIGADATLPLIVDKCLMFSPANGVGYFDAGELVAKGLKQLKRLNTGEPEWFIFALLQFSADYFLAQPGCKQMTFGSDELMSVVNSNLADQNSKFIAVVNDWEKYLIEEKVKRLLVRGSDMAVRCILGKMHDFVVGTKGQKNLPKAYNPTFVPMASTHCKYFEKGQLRYRNDGEAVDLSVFMCKYL